MDGYDSKHTLDNIQGGFELLNLKTGHALTHHRVIELPITEDVIKRVEQLARNQGFQPHAEPIFRTYSLIAGVAGGDDEPVPHIDDEEALYNEDDNADYKPDLELEDDEPYKEEIDQRELMELQNEGAHIPGVDGPHQEEEWTTCQNRTSYSLPTPIRKMRRMTTSSQLNPNSHWLTRQMRSNPRIQSKDHRSQGGHLAPCVLLTRVCWTTVQE